MIVKSSKVDLMRENGLFVSDPFNSEHKVLPERLLISKPTEEELAKVNLTGLDVFPGRTILHLYRLADDWIVECREFIPTLGPGDFVNSFKTEEAAINDVLKFFAGDERWQTKQKLYSEQEERFKRHVPPSIP